MQLEGYRFPSSARPIQEAMEAWEEANGVTLGVTNNSSYVTTTLAECDVKVVFGNLPNIRGAYEAYAYATFYSVNVGEWQRPESGWSLNQQTNLYDVTVPRPEQRDELGYEQLDWCGTHLPSDDPDRYRETLPWWYRDAETNTLYMAAPAHLPYMLTDVVTGLLDQMLDGLGDPEERARKAHERATANLIKYFADGASADLKNLRDEIGNDIRTLTGYESGATTLRATLRDKQQRLDLLIEQSGAHDAAQAAADAFEAMAHHKQIASVKFTGNDLRVETVGLDIEHPTTGRTAYLGQFSVTLNIQSGNVKLKNNDNARNGYDHPHVFIGSPCFGDMDSTIMELTRAGQLLGALEMIFVFLSSVNIRDDWGRSLSYWMEGNAERPTETPELVSA